MEKIEKYMKQTLKNKVKITKALMIAFLINGGFSLAESNPITPGTNLGGENATAIGAGSVSAGSESSSIGTNTFASGNNMTKEEYLKFLKDNKERLSKIEAKMQEIKNDKDEIEKLRQEHDDIINKIDRINNYKKTIEEKEKELNEKEPQILKTIEEKRTEAVKFTKEIEDLEKRIDIISQLDFSKIDENNKAQGVEILAKDLKQKMEDGQTWLKQYGENGIPLEEYKNAVLNYIKYDKYRLIENMLESKFNAQNYSKYEFGTMNLKNVKTPTFKTSKFDRVYAIFSDNDIEIVKTLDNKFYNPQYEFKNDKHIPKEIDLYDIKNLKFRTNFKLEDDFEGIKSLHDDYKEIINTIINSNEPNNKFNIKTINVGKQYVKTANELITKISQIQESNTIDDIELLKLQRYKNQLYQLNEETTNKIGVTLTSSLFEYIYSKVHSFIDFSIKENQQNMTKIKDIYSDNGINEMIQEHLENYPKFDDETLNLINKYCEEIPDSNLTKVYQDEIDRLKKLERDANTFITEKEELIKEYKNDIENLKSLLNGENPSDVEEVNKQIKEKEEKIKKALADIENLKKNLTEIKPGTNALAYGTNSAALGKDSIAFGTNNIAIKESSIAFGTNNFVNGDKSIALGYGHKIIGDKSVALGDPNLIYGDNNFAIGNDIKIGTETQKVNNNLVFGSDVTIDGINNAIVFGNESKPIEGAVSFGNDTTTRKLKYIAKGTDDTDAVNFSQLKDYVKKNAKGKTVNIKNELISKLNYDPDTYLKIDETYLQYISGKKESPKLPAEKKLSLNIDGVKDALGKDSDIANPKDKFVTDKKVHDYVTTNFVSKDSLDLTKFLKSSDVDVTGDGKYITVTSTNNKYKVAFNESELTNTINNSDFTSNKSIQDMLSKKANKDASNLEDTDVTKWQDKLGNGTVTDKDNGLVKGTTVFNYINPIKTQVDQLGTSLNDKLSDITINGDTYIKTEKASKGVYNLSLNKDTLESLINSKTADLAKNDTITNINKELDKKANLDASNLKEQDVKDWQAKLGNGKVDKDNTGLVTGNTVYEVKEDLNKKITTNAENITKLNNTYTTLNDQVTTNTSDISKLKTTVNDLKNTKQDITKINTKLGDIDKSITNINTKLDDKLDKADLSITGDKYIGVKKDNKFNYTLSFNKTDLEKDLDLTNNTSVNNMFTTKLGDINTNIGDLKTKVETNTNNINSLTTKVDDNSNKISDLKASVETNTNNINSLTTKVNTNTKDITTLKKDMANKLNVDADNLTTQGETNLTNKLSKGSDISNPKDRLVTDTKVKQYLDTNFKIQNYVVGKEVLDIKKDAAEASAKAGLALGGVANAIAMANLTTTESGIANLTAAYGTYGKEHALAIGFNGNTPNRRFNYKFGLSTNMKGNLGIGAGVGFVIGGTTEQRQTQQERKIKALEKQLQEMSEVLKKLQLKNNEKNKESIEKH